MLGKHIVPQSEVIRAILLEDSPCCGGSRTGASTAAIDLAVGEAVILLHPPPPLVGVSIGMERERHKNDSLANC